MEAIVAGEALVRAPLRVGGLVPFSTTDWPGRMAAVVFTQGCPWRCGYCHNPHLIPSAGDDERDWSDVLEWLGTRRGLLDAVVFSGGEPTAQPAIVDAVAATRALGFAVGVHTGGMYPRRVPSLLKQVAWFGIDVKAPSLDYESVTGVRASGLGAFVTLQLVREAGIAHEVRTTVHPLLTPPDRLDRLARELAVVGVADWVLQPFRTQGCASAELVAAAPHGASIDDRLLERLREHVPRTIVR
jgi:pyruvate formate lyase activating enzyme